MAKKRKDRQNKKVILFGVFLIVAPAIAYNIIVLNQCTANNNDLCGLPGFSMWFLVAFFGLVLVCIGAKDHTKTFMQIFLKSLLVFFMILSGVVMVISSVMTFGRLLNGNFQVRVQANDPLVIAALVVSTIIFVGLVCYWRYKNKKT